MELNNDYRQVLISSTAGAVVPLSTAVTGRVPYLHRLELHSATTNSVAVCTTASTALVSGPFAMAAKTQLRFPFVGQREGALHAARSKQLGLYTHKAAKGFAIVAWSTST